MKHEILFIYIKNGIKICRRNVSIPPQSFENKKERKRKRKRKKNLSRRIEIVYLKELREEKGMLGGKFFFLVSLASVDKHLIDQRIYKKAVKTSYNELLIHSYD